MGVTVTLTELKTRSRERADMENSTFISDSELRSYINKGYASYYDMIVKAYGEDYFSKNQTITTLSDTESYSLNSDFYKILLVEVKISTNRYSPIKPFEFTDLNRVINKVPSQGREVKITYAPTYEKFILDTDSRDFVNGWEEYVVVQAALSMKDKEESDVRVLLADKQELQARIISSAPDRDTAFPQTISDVATYGSEEINNLPGYRQTNVYQSMRYRVRGDKLFLRGY